MQNVSSNLYATLKMTGLTNRKQTSFSKRGRIFIYILGILAIAFFPVVMYYQNKTYTDTIKIGKNFTTAIINIECSERRSKSRLYIKNQKNELKHVTVNYFQCTRYKIGDIISVYVNQDKDFYVLSPSSLGGGNPF